MNGRDFTWTIYKRKPITGVRFGNKAQLKLDIIIHLGLGIGFDHLG